MIFRLVSLVCPGLIVGECGAGGNVSFTSRRYGVDAGWKGDRMAEASDDESARDDIAATGGSRGSGGWRGSRGSRWARRLGRTALIAGLAVVAIVVAGLPVYVFPPQGDTDDAADLVYVIGPPTSRRINLAESLLKDGTAPAALVSISADEADDQPEHLDFCDEADVTCETPDPFTTKGEALLLEQYAETHPVGRTIVITFTPHVARTRYIFEKCYPGEVTVVGIDERLTPWRWVEQYAYQTAAFVKAWATPCA